MILISTTDMCDTYQLFDPNYNDRCDHEPIQQKGQGTSCFLLASDMITHCMPYEWVDIDCVHELRTVIRLSYISFYSTCNSTDTYVKLNNTFSI